MSGEGRAWFMTLSLFAIGLALAVGLHYLELHARPTGSQATIRSGDLPQRIVSLGPNLTEILFALGSGPQVVGVTNFCNFPPEAAALPRTGGLLDTNLELVQSLAPELVLLQGTNSRMIELCKLSGTPWLEVKMDDVRSIEAGISLIGSAVGRPAEAETLNAAIHDMLLSVSRRTAAAHTVRVFICVGRAPGSLAGIVTVGPDSFISEILTTAGGINIFSDADIPYPQVSKESLLQRQPEVILELRPNERLDEHQLIALQNDWLTLSSVPAVDSGRIFVLTEDYLVIPGPRIGIAAEHLARLLHPETI